MKKTFFIFTIFLVFTGGLYSQEVLPLDDAITSAARGIERIVPQNAILLVIDITQSSDNFSNTVMNELSDQLTIGNKVPVVDRKNLDIRRQELIYQMSGEVDDDSAGSITRTLGANHFVTGTVEDRQTFYRIRFRIINIETSQILPSVIVDLKKDEQVIYLIGGASAVEELKRIERTRPTSNVRNNWVSAEASLGLNLWQGWGAGIGARYERMLNSTVSIGTNFYYYIPFDPEHGTGGMIDTGNIFGIDANIRLYPLKRKFFLGLALGYHNGGNEMIVGNESTSWENGVILDKVDYATANGSGFAITGEMGWKIDVGKEGGFFVQPGFLGTVIMGKYKGHEYGTGWTGGYGGNTKFISGYWRLYLGAGFAF